MSRVLIVATTSFAGMGPYVSEIVNNFEPTDDLYFFFCDYEDHFFKKNIKQELQEKSTFFFFPNTKLNKIKILLSIKPSYFKEILKLCASKKIEVVHFINEPTPHWFERKMQKKGIKCVGTVHDLHPHESKKVWYKSLRFKIFYSKMKRNIILGKNFITNSKDQYNELKKLHQDKKIFFHSFPSLVTDEIRKGSDCPRETNTITKPYILFFGRMEAYKGVSLLYEAFTRHSDLNENYNLVIAGNGSLDFKRHKKEKNVIFINRYIKNSEIASLYKNAKIVIYPYISATQSGVLSLAYFFGVPVLASDVPFFKSSIINHKTGILFKQGDKTDLYNKISYMLTKNLSDLSFNERNYYNQHFDGFAIRKDLLSIYKNI